MIDEIYNMTRHPSELAELLESLQVRIVFAESCTAGLVSARLATVPGVSQWHCGSAVTYREATKAAWLHVREETLLSETAVSPKTTEEMACGVLENTPEANLAVAVTGHLGPQAPEEFDGVIYIAHAWRKAEWLDGSAKRFQLAAEDRVSRQEEAADLVLREACDILRAALQKRKPT